MKPPSLASASPTCSIPPSQPRPLSWGSPATFSAAAVAETAGISAAVVAAGGGPGSGLTEENLRSRERTRSPPASNGSNSNKTLRLGADPAELEEAKSEEEKPTFPPHVPNPFLEKESFLASLMLPASSQIDRARLLDNVAWHLASVAKWAGKNVLGGKLVVPKKLLMASLCSGSGGGELAAHAVTTALGKIFDQECTCQCALVCEAVAYKAQHLCSLVSSLQPAASFCCFDDVVELGTGVGTCRTHHNIVKPPKGAKKGEPSPSAKCPLAYSNERQESDLHGALSGFSCKSFSKQSSQFKVLMSAMKDNANCSSVKTFHGTKECLGKLARKGLLDFFILENVDSMSESNLTICLEALAEIDGVEFEVEVLNLLSSDYSLPQSRRRIYIVGLNKQSTVWVLRPDAMTIITQHLERCKMPIIPWAGLVEPSDGPACAEEVARRLESKRSGSQNGKDAAAAAAGKRELRWVEEHMDLAAKRSKSWPLGRPQEKLKNDWFKTLPDREQEVILFHEDSTAKAPGAGVCQWIDTSQSAHRARATCHPSVVPTLLPGSHLWSTQLQRPLIGIDFLSLQGLPYNKFQTLSDNRQRDLAGNAFSTTAVASVLMSVMVAASVPPPQDSSQPESDGANFNGPMPFDLLGAFEEARSQSNSGGRNSHSGHSGP